MAAAGAELLFPLTELAVMGLKRIVQHLPTYFHLADRAAQMLPDREARRGRADRLPRLQFPHRQAREGAWASRFTTSSRRKSGRGGAVACARSANCCTAVLTALPFEDEWYRAATRADALRRPSVLRRACRVNNSMPTSSRTSERKVGPDRRHLARLAQPGGLSQLCRTCSLPPRRFTRRSPNVRFLVAAFNERHAAMARAAAAGMACRSTSTSGRTPEIIELADVCIAVSGSVSLELMYRAKPTVIVYRVTRLLRWLARRFVKLSYITLVNLLANEEVFPEFLTSVDESDRVASHIIDWLADPAKRSAAVAKIAALRDRVASPGACDRAAEFLLNEAMKEKRANRAA